MSIFYKGFAKFVKEQLTTRKIILENKDAVDTNVFGDNSRSINYLNYQAKTPFVRLTSGVDIPEEYQYFITKRKSGAGGTWTFAPTGSPSDPIIGTNQKTTTFGGGKFGGGGAGGSWDSGSYDSGGSWDSKSYIPPKYTQTLVTQSNDAGRVLRQILDVKTDSDLASRFVLEAGTLNKQSSPPTPSISSLKKGFDILGSDSTYGLDKGFDKINSDDPSEIFNESGDEFGIRPMPGITNVVINSRSTTSIGLKGLRECTISIKCHSLYQLQVLELLYMRPGYTALLEWGHSVYFEYPDSNPTQNIEYVDIFKPGQNRFDVYNDIYQKKIESNGNYDAILGKVNNFSWTADDNGGYDITVNIISMNDIIDSLKINSVVFDTSDIDSSDDDKLKNDIVLSTNPVQFVFGNIIKAFNGFDSTSEEKTYHFNNAGEYNIGFDELFQHFSDDKIKSKLKKLFPTRNINYVKFRIQSTTTEEGTLSVQNQIYINFNDFIKFINTSLIPYEGTTSSKSKITKVISFGDDDYCITHPCQISTNPFVCLIEASGEGFYQDKKGNTQQADQDNIETKQNRPLIEQYINPNFINPNGVVSKVNPIVKNFVNNNGLKTPNGKPPSDREEYYSAFFNKKFDGTGYKFSWKSDGSQKIFVNTEWGVSTSFLLSDGGFIRQAQTKLLNDDDARNNPSTSRLKNQTTTADAGTIVNLFKYGTIEKKNEEGDETRDINGFLTRNFPYRKGKKGKDKFLGKTKNILINTQHIINAAKSSEDPKTKKIVLKDFITNVLRGIEQVTGNINSFSITPYEGEYEDHPSSPTTLKNIEVLRIIDESMMRADFENKDDYYQFPILRYNSLVTDYKLSSTISQNIATTVSIGAQNVGTNHAPTAENSVFNAFNQGIKDRLAQPIIDHINSPDDLALIEQQTSITKADSLFGLFDTISQIFNNNTQFSSNISLASSTLIDYINYFNAQLPAVNKLFYSFTPFPLSLSLTLDGVSGIAVGSIIRLPVDRLPLLYRYLDPEAKDGSFNQAKVAFVIFGVDHTVDDRGWFTNLTCQMVMMSRQSDVDKAEDELKDNTKVDNNKDQEIKDDTTTSTTGYKTAFPELPFTDPPPPQQTLSFKYAVNYLRNNTTEKAAKAIFAVIIAESRKDNAAQEFISAGEYNYAGVQTDSGRWGSSNKFIIGQYSKIDSGNVRRSFAMFGSNDKFLDFMISKLGPSDRDFDGSNSNTWANQYVYKWWSPKNPTPQDIANKKSIYNSAINIYNKIT